MATMIPFWDWLAYKIKNVVLEDSGDNAGFLKAEVKPNCRRNAGVLHRSAITVVDKLTDFTADNMTVADGGEDTGSLAKSTAHYICAIPGNRWGPTKSSAAIDTVTTAAYTHDDGSLVATIAQGTGPNGAIAEWYDIFCSVDAAPKWVARITEAQRAAGCQISALGTVVGQTATQVAAAIAAALVAQTEINTAFAPTSSTNNVLLTKRRINALYTANDTTLNISVPGDVAQVETATVVGAVTEAGNLHVVVTAAGMFNSPKQVVVAVTAEESVNDTATAIRAALNADPDIPVFFTVSGSTSAVVLTAKTAAVNDTTLNIAIHHDTGAGVTAVVTSAHTTAGSINTTLGFTADTSSDNTTAGVVSVLQVETATCAGTITKAGNLHCVLTAAGMTGSAITLEVAVALADTATAVCTKVKAAMAANANIVAWFTIGGTATTIVLTTKAAAADDNTMNINLHNDTCEGFTNATSSTHTTAGAAGTAQVETAVIVANIKKTGTAIVIVTSTALASSPIVVPVTVSDVGRTGITAGTCSIQVVGTGIQTSDNVFKNNNAYTPNVATNIRTIDCTGWSKAHIKAKFALTDLRTAPALTIVPFFGNQVSTGDWHQGVAEPVSVLNDLGQSLEREYVLSVDGETALRVLVGTLTGQGAAASVWIEKA